MSKRALSSTLVVLLLSISYLLVAQEIEQGSVSALPAMPQSGPASAQNNAPTLDTQIPKTHSMLRRLAEDRIYLAPFHPSNLKWNLLFMAGGGRGIRNAGAA